MVAAEFEIVAGPNGLSSGGRRGSFGAAVRAALERATSGNSDAMAAACEAEYEDARDSIETVTLFDSRSGAPAARTRVPTRMNSEQTESGAEITVSAGSRAEAMAVASQSAGTGIGPAREVLGVMGVGDERDAEHPAMSRWFMEPTNSLGRLAAAIARRLR